MSGRSNVVHWFKSRGLDATDERIDRVLRAAKEAETLLTDEQIMKAADGSPAN